MENIARLAEKGDGAGGKDGGTSSSISSRVLRWWAELRLLEILVNSSKTLPDGSCTVTLTLGGRRGRGHTHTHTHTVPHLAAVRLLLRPSCVCCCEGPTVRNSSLPSEEPSQLKYATEQTDSTFHTLSNRIHWPSYYRTYLEQFQSAGPSYGPPWRRGRR